MATKDYFSDLEGFGSGPALPSFSDSGFSTPRLTMSRKSSRPTTTTRPGGSSSPPPLPSTSTSPVPASSPNGHTDHEDHDDRREDDILTDPRRFTPTLHASLVSEILKVRGELDSKHKFIEDLEAQLKLARDEKDELREQMSRTEKDSRAMKRQFQQLEHGTLAALEELAKDRDSAKASGADAKAKLEAAQKKIKSLEDDAERRHAVWEKERLAWEAEKRGFERRVHITETRLKTVLEELAAHHDAASRMHENGVGHDDEDNTRDSGVGDESDTASIQASPSRNGTHGRSMSASSRRSLNRYRFSTQSIAGHDSMRFNGVSLADELQLDEEDEEFDEHDEYHDEDAKTRRPIESRLSQHHDERPAGKRGFGIVNDSRRTLESPVSFDWRKSIEQPAITDQKPASRSETRPPYVDSGVQYSPPASPVVVPTHKDADSKVPEVIPQLNDDQIEANQRKKRVAPNTTPFVDRGQQMSPVPEKEPTIMVSTSSQTMEDRPLSPPATPKITPPDSPAESKAVPLGQQGQRLERPEMLSISTQTDPVEEPKVPAAVVASFVHVPPPPVPMPIPSIAIHPPTSRSPSPTNERETVLPPGTKNASSQTTNSLYRMTSTAVQTEEILTQKRLQRLPAHLLPSFISSNPPTPEQTRKTQQRSVSDKGPSTTSDRMSPPPRGASPSIEQRYPGNNDNGPLYSGDKDAPRRPFRNSSLFAGFGEDEDDIEQNDEESKSGSYQTPAMTNRIMKGLRHFGGSRPSPVPEDKEVETNPRDSYAESITSASAARPSLENRTSFDGKGKMPMRGGNMSRQSNSIRRSAMIQSGANAHRSRTPSVTSVGSSFFSSKSVGPPFPVPDRASSRKMFPLSKSEGSQSPTPRGAGLFGNRRGATGGRGDFRGHERKDSLRKVRSATVIQRTNSGRRVRSRSPPLPAAPSSFPPLPQDNVEAPAKVYASQRQRSNEKSLSKDLSSVVGHHEQEQPSQGTVIDAIAAAMVGEWMWKYVRRRKSFGVGEAPQDAIGRPGTDGSVNVTGNGVRHKRWVWLSPYERAVMWSTKQPASNSALMGKSGRKLVIQSVLDVRDDTPLPKNHGIAEPFYRSILILTPARALKFTAMSRDRHYTWLTALSFLAHSPLLTPGMALQPPEEPDPEVDSGRAPSLRRTRIHDSVRIAKDKARPQPGSRLNGVNRASPTIHEWGGAAPAPSVPGNGSMDSDPVPDAAEAPTVPRFAHGRKRSATGPRLPSSIRPPYRDVVSPSLPSATSSDFVINSGGVPSGRSSEVSSGNRFNFFDDPGTVRMQAFVDGAASSEGGGRSSQDSSVFLGGNRRRNPRWSGASSADPRRSGMVYSDDFDAFDPFKGF
ncbi:uncharacterized protein PV09_03533 [Verruconis gallopava]|uniref:Pleckstrin homology domain-containing protein n=1 Tax=Verruconis gallopava TaxID=253628 RepID=A0A0D2B2X8_9PEZI|nr:uncharacterized protein PV09_03533 [Verruconis gallopava]KIW05669.1 hypothetical protein PV09_03533 [Verruconis gallopava]